MKEKEQGESPMEAIAKEAIKEDDFPHSFTGGLKGTGN